MSEDARPFDRYSGDSLRRLLPRLEARFADQTDPDEWGGYLQRLKAHFPHVFSCLYRLYGHHYDFFYHLETIIAGATEGWLNRPSELKALDAMRESDPHWHQSNRLVGATCYVDLFAGDLAGLRARIPYLSELGVNYLHLMPLYRTPEGDSDGGYAVSSYREVRRDLGTIDELAELASELRYRGISLCLDFVFNHTSDESEWARRALAGEVEYQEFYRMFPDRQLPDAYERTLVPIFPDEHPGAFTYRDRIKKWVWTTFHNYQWDLNYENPAVFAAMLEEMLHLANLGVEVLRLDAVAFLWKRLGTTCQNLPEAHTIIRAYNGLARIAAPAMVFKSEAIVHPDEVRLYIDEGECQLSYNPQLMALLWSALATREVDLVVQALRRGFEIPGGCSWVNYIRCHDDIGWAFSDQDIAAVGLDPRAHRRFLADFFTGDFEGSFARGLPFQLDPDTGDARVSGTCASLAGLEMALTDGDDDEVEISIRRILLLHGVILTIGGIPLISLGDEIGVLNDYDFENDPDKEGDSRWVHRAPFDWGRAEQRLDAATVPGRIYQGLMRLIQIRQQNPAFSRSDTEFVTTGNDHVLAYFRSYHEHGALVIANFSDSPQRIEGRRLRLLGLRRTVVDLVRGQTIVAGREIVLEPYDLLILSRSRE